MHTCSPLALRNEVTNTFIKKKHLLGFISQKSETTSVYVKIIRNYTQMQPGLSGCKQQSHEFDGDMTIVWTTLHLISITMMGNIR
jgi:hypothetical protein